MYKNTLFAILIAIFLIGSPASTAIEETAIFVVGDKWALGKEINFMDEFIPEINLAKEEIDKGIRDGELKDNSTGMEILSYNLDENKAILGFYYTSEILDDFDELYNMETKQSLYSHTVFSTQFTGNFISPGTYFMKSECTYSDTNGDEYIDDDEEDCTIVDGDTGEALPLEEVTATMGGEMHYVVVLEQNTWWTQDSNELQKIDFTITLGASGAISIINFPNWTAEEDSESCDENENGTKICYMNATSNLEAAILGMSAEASLHLLFEFAEDEPMNVLDLPLEENKYWDGITNVTISGDLGGRVNIEKPVLSICPDLNCDKLPEMQELYSNLTDGIAELHSNEEFSVTVDRNNDGLPDVITKWNDLFPMYIPETWMDDIFQEILGQISCEDDESAQEGEDCDETAEEEFEKLNLRVDKNRVAFGPYSIPAEEGMPYAFETGEKEIATSSDGTKYEGYQVIPTDDCSDNNPNRDCGDDKNEEEEIFPDGKARAGDEDSEGCHEDDIFCDAEVIWFHDANTGHPAYMSMNLPNARENGFNMEMTEIDVALAEKQIEINANPKKPQKSSITPEEIPHSDDDSALPGFGVMAASGSLLFAGRRFRK